MKVVLLQDIKGTGKKGDVKEVSDGYARNFLFPKKLAREVTASVMNELTNKKNAEDHKRQLELLQAEKIKSEIDGEAFTVKAKSGAGDRLFGSVTTKEIAASIEEKTGHAIDRRKILLDRDIKQYGKYEVSVKIYSGITRLMKVIITSFCKKERTLRSKKHPIHPIILFWTKLA